MTELLPVGIHYGVAQEVYRADPGYNYSTVKDFGQSRTPAHFLFQQAQPREITPALRIGSCLDSAIHDTAEDHASKFAIWEGTRQKKGYADFEREKAPRTILTSSEADAVTGCELSLARHEDAQKILAVSRKQVCAIATHPLGFRLKALLDILPDRDLCSEMLLDFAFDLKSALDASPAGFSDACWKFKYHFQAYHYLKALEYCGVFANVFGFIVVETSPPYLVAIHFIKRGSPEWNYAEAQFEELLARYHKCKTTNIWSDYGSEWSAIRFKNWQTRPNDLEREVLA